VDILRGEWGFDGFVCSDAGAIAAMHRHHKVTADALQSAVLAVRSGCDLEIGRSYPTQLPAAVEQGLLSEEDVDRCLARVLKARFRLGMFDEPKDVPYAAIRGDVVQCERHIALAREAAVKSCVLLKNNGVLPLGPQVRTICVSGPNAGDVDVLLGNFYRSVSARLVSVLEGIVGAAPEGTTITYMKGCHLCQPNEYPSDWVIGLSEWADVVVAVMGISPLMEGEAGECIASPTGGDRREIGLPENQLDLLRKFKAKGKPLVVVVTGGSPVAMPEVHEMADAVLFIWYPGEQGGAAVGDILFGSESPSGRLPVTFPMSLEQVPPFEDYSMAGRTYRYSHERPLYPFGFGLSYTRFEYGALELSPKKGQRGESVRAEAAVTNAGGCAAEEVVQLYVRDDEASARTPRWSLKAFTRVRLAPGEQRKVCFEITPEMMELIGEDGEAVLEPGTFTVWAGGSSPDERSAELGAPKPASARFEVV
jgi:beta-glucosidase